MARITNIPTTWTSVGAATTVAEIWQCIQGAILISTDAVVPTGDSGMVLEVGQSREISIGQLVHYRSRHRDDGVLERAIR